MAQAVAQVVPADASLRIMVKQLLAEYEALVGRLVKSFLAVAQGTLPAADQVNTVKASFVSNLRGIFVRRARRCVLLHQRLQLTSCRLLIQRL